MCNEKTTERTELNWTINNKNEEYRNKKYQKNKKRKYGDVLIVLHRRKNRVSEGEKAF